MVDKFVPSPPPVEAPEEPASVPSVSSSPNPSSSFSEEEKADLLKKWNFTTRNCFDLSEHCTVAAQDLFSENERSQRKARGWIILGAASTVGYFCANHWYTAATRRVWRIRNPQYVQMLFFSRIASGLAVALSAFLTAGPYPFAYPALIDDNVRRIAQLDAIGFSALAIAEKARLLALENEEEGDTVDSRAKQSVGGDSVTEAPISLPFDESVALDYLHVKLSVAKDKSSQCDS